METKKINILNIYNLFEKYGDLNLKVNTPFGFKHIEACDITAKNSAVMTIVTNNHELNCSPGHLLKSINNKFIPTNELRVGQKLQTVSGPEKINTIIINDFKKDLYDIQVADVKQYYANGIVSHNSSVIKAIQFALFYEIPNSATLVKMINKYNRDKPASVEVYFTKSGKKYKVKRTLIPKKSNVETQVTFVEIDDNEDILFNLTKESRPYTEEELKKYLGINETFEMLSVFSAQKKQVEFIDCKNAERLKLVNKFLGLQNFELKESNVLTALKEKKAVYDNIIKQFDKEIDQTYLEKSKKKYEFLLKNAIVEEAELKGEIEELEFHYKDIITVYNSNLKESKRKIEEPVKLLRQIDDLRVEENENNLRISNNVLRINELKKSSSEYIDRFCLEHPEFSHPNDWKADYTVINKCKQDIAVLEHDIKRSKKQLTMTMCDNCGKEFSDEDRGAVEEKIKKWSDEVDDIELFIDSEEDNMEVMKDKVKIYKDLITEIEKLEGKENPMLSSCVKDIIIEISELQMQIVEFKNIQEAKLVVSLLVDRIEQFNEEKRVQTLDLSNIQVTIGTYTSKIKEIDGKIEEYKVRVKLLYGLEDEIRLLKAYRKIVNKDGLPLYILKSKIEEINEKVNLVVSQVFDFEIEFSIDEERGELKIQFSYPDEPDGNDIGLASGSETFMINVCIKVGLSQISNLPKIDSFFIDEGYDCLDAKVIEKLPALFSMLTNYYRNVVTISHLEIVKDMCSHQIKLEKVDKYTKII